MDFGLTLLLFMIMVTGCERGKPTANAWME